MFNELALSYQSNFKKFAPYPKASDRKAWLSLDSDTLSALISKGVESLNYKFPYLYATEFMKFSRTGNRTYYENKLFSKRQALSAIVLAECAEHNGRYMDNIINGIFSICDETAWFLPAHNTYIRDTPQHLLPDYTQPVVDIFACETAAVLAVTYYLLKDELDNVSPVISERIIYEINRRVLNPYISTHFWWMGKDDEPMCNWTIWCTQNVLLSAFLIPCDNKMLKKIFNKACQSIDYYLKDFGEDGCCDEGAQYYRHSALCLYQTMDILCRITDNHFATLFENTKIKNIAMYIVNVHVDDEYYINFADCSPIAGRAGIREYLFGKACNLPELTNFAILDYHRNPVKFQPDENNLYYRLQEVFTRSQILAEAIPDTLAHPPIYYESVGLFIARNNTYTLAVKAGNNDDSHNHNDTGSITLYKNGMPFLIDIGVENYSKKTFSDRRYEIWTMRSDYHNLPTINGCMQNPGAKYKADVLNYAFTPDGGSISVDIADAYPLYANAEHYIRDIVLNNQGLTLKDTLTTKYNDQSDVKLNFITYNMPVLDGNRLILEGIGEIILPDSYETENITFREIPINDSRLMTCWKHSIYRIKIPFSSKEIELLFK